MFASGNGNLLNVAQSHKQLSGVLKEPENSFSKSAVLRLHMETTHTVAKVGRLSRQVTLLQPTESSTHLPATETCNRPIRPCYYTPSFHMQGSHVATSRFKPNFTLPPHNRPENHNAAIRQPSKRAYVVGLGVGFRRSKLSTFSFTSSRPESLAVLLLKASTPPTSLICRSDNIQVPGSILYRFYNA